VCDGIGSGGNGAQYSSLVPVLLAHFIASHKGEFDSNSFTQIIEKIKSYLPTIYGLKPGGTTVSLALTDKDGLTHIVTMGDSPAILLYPNKRTTLLNHLNNKAYLSILLDGIKNGATAITSPFKRFMNASKRNIVSSDIGLDEKGKVETGEIEYSSVRLKAGEKILLCSDGLFENIAQSLLQKIEERVTQEFARFESSPNCPKTLRTPGGRLKYLFAQSIMHGLIPELETVQYIRLNTILNALRKHLEGKISRDNVTFAVISASKKE